MARNMEIRRKISESLSGHAVSEQTRRKISEAVHAEAPSSHGLSQNCARALVLERDEALCQSCGGDDHPEVHHLDFDRDHREPENQVVLCRRCHHLLHEQKRSKR